MLPSIRLKTLINDNPNIDSMRKLFHSFCLIFIFVQRIDKIKFVLGEQVENLIRHWTPFSVFLLLFLLFSFSFDCESKIAERTNSNRSSFCLQNVFLQFNNIKIACKIRRFGIAKKSSAVMNIVLSSVSSSQLRNDEKLQLEKIENLSRINKFTIRSLVNRNAELCDDVKRFMLLNHLANPYEYSIVVVAKKTFKNPILMSALNHGYLDEEELRSIDDDEVKEISSFIQMNHSWIKTIMNYYVKKIHEQNERVKLSKLIDRVKKNLNSISRQLRTDNLGRFLNSLNEFSEFEIVRRTSINPNILDELIRNLRQLSATNENKTKNSDFDDFFDDAKGGRSGRSHTKPTDLELLRRPAGRSSPYATEAPNQLTDFSETFDTRFL